MKKIPALIALLAIGMATCPLIMAQSETTDYPLLSQGAFEPPPPPPGYAVTLPPMEPMAAPPPPPPDMAAPDLMTAPPPPPPMMAAPEQLPASTTIPAPVSAPIQTPVETPAITANPVPAPPPLPMSATPDVPEAAKFNQPMVPVALPQGDRTVQVISEELSKQIMRLVRALKTYRTIVEQPESDEQLRRILNTGRCCAEVLGLQNFPAPSKFVVSSRDRVVRDRSHQAVEYRHFGDFDNRINGWVKPIETAVYLDLVFDGRNRRRTHIRAQFTRTGPLTGYFYAYSWDAHGNQWKLQGSLDNIFVRDNGMPSGGEMKIYGADPAGRVMAVNLSYPIRIQGEPEPEKTDIRHREGKRVSIGN